MSAEHLPPETEIGGFRLKRFIGEGAMGEVYLAQDLSLGRRVALKLIKPGLMRDDSLARFADEARTTATFSHPNIVTIHAVGDFRGRPFLALEFLDGQTLRQRLADGALAPREAMRITRAIADAVAEAHQRELVHADLKPENVAIPSDGRVRVLDFGLARMVGTSTGTSGTPAYMAPERWRGAPMTGAADVWAIGLMLYELIAGRKPLSDAQLATFAYGAAELDLPTATSSQSWGPLVVSCLRRDPSARITARNLVCKLDELLLARGVKWDDERSPFPGLVAFTRGDAAQYVGRQLELDALVEQLRWRPLIPITGPSGVGKSSFVHAGLLPRLDEAARWRVIAIRPGASPFSSLAAGLRGASDPQLAKSLLEHPDTLSLALRDLAKSHDSRILLFIDQFEETFTLAPDEAVAFCEGLSTSADADEPWRIVLTVRDDFVGRLADSPHMRLHLSSVVPLDPMTLSELRSAVQVPLHHVGFETVPEGLAERIASDVVNQPASLSLLQFTCYQLWERRDVVTRTISAADYEAIGGASGALAAHADSVIKRASPDQVPQMRSILLAVVHPDGTRRPRRRSEILDGMPDGAASLLDRLVAARLIVATRDADRDEATLEIAHEALVRAWPQFARWVDEGYEERLLLVEIEQASLLWVRRGRRDGETWAGAALAEAIRRVAEWNLSLGTTAQEFLDAGVRRDARSKRSRRWLVGSVIVGLATAALAATFAAVEFSHREQEALDQQEQIRLAAADIGEFELRLEPFGWSTSRQARTIATRMELRWQLDRVATGGDVGPTHGTAYGASDVTSEPAQWEGSVQVQTVQARSGPAFLEVHRGSCPPSIVFIQHLPGYRERSAHRTLHIWVPACEASQQDMRVVDAGVFFRNISLDSEHGVIDVLAWLPKFSIDRAEVTWAAYDVYASMEDITGDATVRPQSNTNTDRFPVVGVGFRSARDYCQYHGKDLPTVEQWQKALRGGIMVYGEVNESPRRLTPWITATSDHPANLLYPNSNDVAEIGTHPDDTSLYGVVDMAGNVSEWSLSRPSKPGLERYRSVLGGNWDIPVGLNFHLVSYRNSRHDQIADFTVGIRCVSAAQTVQGE